MKKFIFRLFLLPAVAIAAVTTSAASESALEAFSRGVAHYESGQYDLAREEFERAVGRRGDYAEAHFNLALVAWRQWRFEDAIGHFARVISLAPAGEMAPAARRGVETLQDLALRQAHLEAVRRYERGDYDGARQGFERVIGQRPDYVEAYFNLAILYWRRREFPLSRRNFERVIELAPGSELARQAAESIEIFLFEGYL